MNRGEEEKIENQEGRKVGWGVEGSWEVVEG